MINNFNRVSLRVSIIFAMAITMAACGDDGSGDGGTGGSAGAGGTGGSGGMMDMTAPTSTISGGPTGVVPDTEATFNFAADEPATFECSLDGADFAPCSSPVIYDSLDVGAHSFEVRATDAASNVEDPPAERTWSICAVQNVSYDIDATTDVAIDNVSGNKGPINRLSAYRNPGSSLEDVTGWSGYDLSGVPDNVDIDSITMSYHHEVGFSNPFSNPVVVVHYSTGNDWERDTVMLADLPRTEIVSDSYDTFTTDDWNAYSIDVAARDWTSDLSDDWITFGLTNTNDFYSYVYFFGTDDPATTPFLTIEGTLCE